jgi:hypothetical protein
MDLWKVVKKLIQNWGFYGGVCLEYGLLVGDAVYTGICSISSGLNRTGEDSVEAQAHENSAIMSWQ